MVYYAILISNWDFKFVGLQVEFDKMVSDASKKKAAQKKAAAAAKRGGKAAAAASSKSASESQNGADKLANGVDGIHISDRTCTGVLCSHPLSRDIRVCISYDVVYSGILPRVEIACIYIK